MSLQGNPHFAPYSSGYPLCPAPTLLDKRRRGSFGRGPAVPPQPGLASFRRDPTRRQREHRPPFPDNALRGAMPGTYADLVPRDGSAGAFLPETEHVAGGVTERRNPQVSFGVGSLDDLATLSLDLLDGVVDAVDVDVGQQTGLA